MTDRYVKNIVKKIYLTFRKILLYFLGMLLFRKGSLQSVEPRNIRKILFIRIDRIGDLILSTPTLRSLKQAFPEAQIVLLASLANQAIALNSPHVDRILVFDYGQSMIDKIGVIRKLRKMQFDLAVDPYNDYELKTALICFASGAERRLGYSADGREVFFNIPVAPPRCEVHFVDQTLNILTPLAIDISNKQPEIFLSEDEKKWAIKWIESKALGAKPIVGIHPGAHYESQRWNQGRFQSVITGLLQLSMFDVVVFGGCGDERIVKNILPHPEGAVRIHISGDYRQFASLLATCSLLVCNNSGPLHTAVALNVPTVSIMGPTIREVWHPIGNIHQVLRADGLPCIGCNLGYCKQSSHECMEAISPFDVLEVVKQTLLLQLDQHRSEEST